MFAYEVDGNSHGSLLVKSPQTKIGSLYCPFTVNCSQHEKQESKEKAPES